MAFSVIQAGTSLQLLDAYGQLTTLTLPTGISLRADVPPRFSVYGQYVILANTPDQPLTIDASGTVRLLCPAPPRLAPVLSGPNAGSLSGTYSGARYTFVTLDAIGNIISESDYSPASNSVTIAAKLLKAASLDVSPDQITGRRLYRPTTNGATLFQWVDLDGNVITTIEDDLSDAGLSLIASPILGTPPHLTLVASFRGRVFGVSSDDIDNVRYTEAGIQYAWPADNVIPIQPVGEDTIGVSGFIKRRDALGIGRRNQLVQLVGTGSENADGDIDFDPVTLSEILGVISQEAVSVYRDVGYFLWEDGVYEWSSGGITCVSDGDASGKGNVRKWFTTNDYFNRERFPFAFSHIDPVRLKYRLFLASADSTTEDRWVEFDIKDRTWWGPHKTGAFSPTSAFNVQNAQSVKVPLIGSAELTLYREQDTRTDGSATAIDFDVVGKRHDLLDPDVEKYFGELSMHGKKQTTGNLSIISLVGELNDTSTTAPRQAKTQKYQMTKSRQRLGRLGHGKHLELRFRNNVAGDDVEIYGYEVDPVHPTGRR